MDMPLVGVDGNIGDTHWDGGRDVKLCQIKQLSKCFSNVVKIVFDYLVVCNKVCELVRRVLGLKVLEALELGGAKVQELVFVVVCLPLFEVPGDDDVLCV